MASTPRSVTFSPEPIRTVYPSRIDTATNPQKKQKMSISETYSLAHAARAKLLKETSRPDHALRMIVGHANLLDSIMLELADAEREQEHWFTQSVLSSEDKSADWPNAVEEPAHDWAAEDAESDSSECSDDGSEDDELELSVQTIPMPTRPAPFINVTSIEVDDDFAEYEDDEAESGDLALVRVPSHPPPDLLHDSDDDSDGDSMPPSPPQQLIHDFTDEERKAISTTSYYDQRKSARQRAANAPSLDVPSLFDEDYFLPGRESTTIAAY